MNSLAVAAAALITVLLLLDLLLTVAVIRRLRDHTSRLGVLEATPVRRSGPVRGAAFPEFSARTVDGVAVDHGQFGKGQVLIGIFASSCGSCRVHMPEFLQIAKELPRERVLVLVLGDPDEGDDLVRSARTASRVIVDPEASQITTGLNLPGVPMFLALDNGRITAVGTETADVEKALALRAAAHADA